jgi:hypothetical protein
MVFTINHLKSLVKQKYTANALHFFRLPSAGPNHKANKPSVTPVFGVGGAGLHGTF